MRTAIDPGYDAFMAAEEIARAENTRLGKFISRLLRQALTGGVAPQAAHSLHVNVLIALLDAAHMHHARASQWLQQEVTHGWASCHLTENGCLDHGSIRLPLSSAKDRRRRPPDTSGCLFRARLYG
jgi:hypothetical protein